MVAAIGLLVTLAAAASPERPPPNDPGGERRALRGSEGRLRAGVIDARGAFVPALGDTFADGPEMSGPAPLAWVYNLWRGAPRATYEHRAGTVVAGVVASDQFVPEVGSRVRRLADVVADGKASRWVYNHPRFSELYRDEPARADGPPPRPAPPPAKPKLPNISPAFYTPERVEVGPFPPPPGWSLMPFDKAYNQQLPDGDPFVVRLAGAVAELGHLDPCGEFSPDYRVPVMRVDAAPTTATLFGAPGNKWRFRYNVPVAKEPESVCEFRSGRVLTGVLRPDGLFVPEVGSEVIAFSKYDPASAPRIYNLPGVLRPVAR